MDLNDLKNLKVEPGNGEPLPGEKVLAIIRVKERGYTPPGISVRSRIDDELFTAEMPAERAAELRHDERVASIELSRRLEKID